MRDLLKERQRVSRNVADDCVKEFVTRRAVPNSTTAALLSSACAACRTAISDSCTADFEWDRFLMGRISGDPNRAIRSTPSDRCAVYGYLASNAIDEKKVDAERAVEPIRRAKYKKTLNAADNCQDEQVTLFALSTSESPENISVGSYNKCRQLYRLAAKALFSPSFRYGDGRVEELVEEHLQVLKAGRLERDVRIVIEARSRLRRQKPRT